MFYNGYNNWYGSSFTASSTSTSTTSDSSHWYSSTSTVSDVSKEIIDMVRRVQQEEARWKEKDDAMDEYISQISVLGA